MQLNLPILPLLADSQRILIAGAGGGFDFLGGVPLLLTLREAGKTVHLANYSFLDFQIAKTIGDDVVELGDGWVLGVGPKILHEVPFFAEGYFARWWLETFDESIRVWMFANTGANPLRKGYAALIEHLDIDALILVDGGVDSLMRGDEQGAGTFVEDTISLAAVRDFDIPVKILACIGFGTEVEEGLNHYVALENMAALARAGGFYGACALTPQMPVFQHYEAAARYIWEQPGHGKSHIHTRIIPAVHGEFGDVHMYPDARQAQILVSPLMSLYWFYDVKTVIAHSVAVDLLYDTNTTHEAFRRAMRRSTTRPNRRLPY